MADDGNADEGKVKAKRKPRRPNTQPVPPPVKPKELRKPPRKKEPRSRGEKPEVAAKRKAQVEKLNRQAAGKAAGVNLEIPNLGPLPFDVPRPLRGAYHPRFFAFMRVLGAGGTVMQAAAAGQYNEVHAYRLWRKPETQALLSEIQAARLEQAARDMTDLRHLALRTVRELLESPDTPRAVKRTLSVNVLDRSGFSPQHRLQIDTTVRQAPMAALTVDELLFDLRKALALEDLPAEEIDRRIIEARAQLPHDLG